MLRDRLTQCGLGQARRVGEKPAERLDVAHQVVDRLRLARLVLLRERRRVVDEELDVVAPHRLPVEERLRGFVAVHGTDRL